MNREEAKKHIKFRLRRKYVRRYKSDRQWAWTLIKNAVRDSKEGDKIEIIRLIESASIVKKAIDSAADQEADMMLSDDNLSLTELARILGDD